MNKDLNDTFQERPIILVDNQDNIIGYEEVLACHMGEGLQHRAFSIFIFNREKQLLIQKRSSQKLLWPEYWSNSVCSHPRKGESYHEAAVRRLPQEIGLQTELFYLYKFPYHARYKDVGSERELCAVFFGIHDGPARAHPDEVSDWRYIGLEQLDRDILSNPQLYTPWFQLEWQQVKTHHLSTIFKG